MQPSTKVEVDEIGKTKELLRVLIPQDERMLSRDYLGPGGLKQFCENYFEVFVDTEQLKEILSQPIPDKEALVSKLTDVVKEVQYSDTKGAPSTVRSLFFRSRDPYRLYDRLTNPESYDSTESREIFLRLWSRFLYKYRAFFINSLAEAILHYKTVSLTFRHSRDYRTVVLGGQEFNLTPTEAFIIRMLHEEYLDDTPDLGQDTILAELGVNIKRLRDCFSNRITWQALVKKGETKGSFRLNI